MTSQAVKLEEKGFKVTLREEPTEVAFYEPQVFALQNCCSNTLPFLV